MSSEHEHRRPRRPMRAHPAGADKSARLPRRAVVRDRHRLTTTGTVLVDFEVVDDDPFPFAPGQFVAIDFVHPTRGYRRSPYCLYGASSEEGTFTLLVRVVEEGPVSIFLSELERGDLISFRGPSGHSMIPPDESSRLVLIPTGVGIGPCLLLLRHLVGHDRQRPVLLFWGLRMEADICLTSELDLLASELPAFEWEVVLSRPSSTWAGAVGRVTDVVPERLSELAGTRFYLTSNGRMVAEMGAALREAGVASADIYEESFFDHRHKAAPDVVEAILGRFVATDLTSPFSDLDATLRRRD